VSTSADFAFSSNDPLATFECALDDPLDWGSCQPTTSFTGLTVGPHNLLVRAKNEAGVVDDTPASHQWTILPLPETTITSAPADPIESTTATFEFSSDQPGATFECALDDAPDFLPCESGISYTGLALGEHDFRARAKDAAGNVDPTPADYSWEIGDIPAPVTITSGPEATTTSTSATFDFSADELNPVFECALDGAAFSLCSSPVTYNGLPLGAHTFQVRIFNLAAVAEPPITTYAWTVLNTPTGTDVAVEIVPLGGATAELVALIFDEVVTSGDTTATVLASVPSAPNDFQLGNLNYDINTTASFNGSVTVCLNYDPASFTDPLDVRLLHFDGSDWVDVTSSNDPLTGQVCGVVTSLSPFGVAVPAGDTTPPDTSFTSAPVSGILSADATFTFVANELGATFLCQLDEEGFVPCASSVSYTGLAVGTHAFEVRAIDAAGNLDQTAAIHTWTIEAPLEPTPSSTASPEPTGTPTPTDTPAPPTATPTPADTTAPETTIDSGPEATTDSTDAAFTFSANEDGSTFECSLNGVAFEPCASPVGRTGLAIGAHTFEVWATDAAGNTDETPASFSWTVEPPPDTTDPETTVDSGPEGNTESTDATLAFSANEGGSTFECSLDGTGFAGCVSPVQLTGLAVGAHTFTVRATDAAGNVDETPASYSWTVEAPVDCGPEVTVSANADAWIDQNSSGNNYGSDSILKVQAKSSNNFRALVRFDMPASIPQGCVVQSATLRLYAASSKSGRTLQAFRIAGSWSENSVKWNNQPQTTDSAATTNSGSGYRQWNVTGQVQAMYDAGANNGFLIRDSKDKGDAEQQFHSREKGESMPQLVISFAPAGG
jgi:hypothetical protein